MPMTKRDLLKLGVTSMAMLERPLPSGKVCEVNVALRADDDGAERNRVVSFNVVAVLSDPTADDDFGAAAAAPAAVPPPASEESPAPAQATAPLAVVINKQPAVGKFSPGQTTLPCMAEPKAKKGGAE